MSQAAGWYGLAVSIITGRMSGPPKPPEAVFLLCDGCSSLPVKPLSYAGSPCTQGAEAGRVGNPIAHQVPTVCCANARVLGRVTESPLGRSRGLSVGRSRRESSP